MLLLGPQVRFNRCLFLFPLFATCVAFRLVTSGGTILVSHGNFLFVIQGYLLSRRPQNYVAK
jgi:hypothetical protein